MDAGKRLGPRRDVEVIQEYERLDQLADVGGADEARDGTVPAAAGGLHDAAGGGARGLRWRILDIEKAAAKGGCGSGAHFHLHKGLMKTGWGLAGYLKSPYISI
jgi:hypothetical protein